MVAVPARLRRPATWVALALAGFSLLTVQYEYAHTYTDGGNGELTLLWVYTSCGVAAASAWESSDVAPVLRRRRLRGLLVRVWPFVLAPAAIFGMVLLVLALARGTGAAPSTPLFLLVALLHGAGWAALGCALGRWLPAILAVPLAVGFAFSLQALPPALTFGSLRHMYAPLSVGGGASHRLIPVAVFTTSASLTGLCLLGLGVALWRPRHSPVPILPIVAGIALTALGAHYGARTPTPESVPRSTAALHCSDGVCTWPEPPGSQEETTREALRRFRDHAPASWVPRGAPPVLAGEWQAPEYALTAWYRAFIAREPGIIGDESCRSRIAALPDASLADALVTEHGSRYSVAEVAALVDDALLREGVRPCAAR